MGGLYLVDTSALARARHGTVRDELARLGEQGLLATCVTVDLEVLYSARNPTEYAQIARSRSELLTELPVTPECTRRARAAQAQLARHSQHRAAGVLDLLTAAVADYHSATILHYESDFDKIAEVTGQAAKWVVPRGSIP